MKTPNCSKCNHPTKVSSYYSDMWFCSNCNHGDYLKEKEPPEIIKTGIPAFPSFHKNLGKTITAIPAPSFKVKEKDQDYVYHVAHPNVKGLIVGTTGVGKRAKKLVIFETPVSFPKRSGRKSKRWICTPKYLYESQDEALKNNKPELC